MLFLCFAPDLKDAQVVLLPSLFVLLLPVSVATAPLLVLSATLFYRPRLASQPSPSLSTIMYLVERLALSPEKRILL